MYTYDMRVGFSQVDTDRLMKMEALTAVFQDVTCFQGEEIGNGFALLEPRKQAWLLNSWQIEVKRFPAFNEKISVGTFPTSFKGFIGNRNFVVKDETGDNIVMANSIWTFMDMAKIRPVKVDEEFISRYTLEEPLPMNYAARKIALPETEDWLVTEKEAIKVREHYLDSNMHVNNGQYIQIAAGFFAKGIKYNQMRVEYRNQARLGDMIIPVVYKKEKACIVALCGTDKKPYAIIEAVLQ
ncbi:MAG: acyl-[Lachnospiraceae bacterium]|nr:acyl-[acyl-carrier-protein] thioesterase [Lachnospiraceae bacterium]